ncbi:hypothetical protein PSV3_00126 [Septimatrevirus PSV32]|uniref:Uncharacterized protein n=1 Tax=Pseudomonas phage PSV3 TaxID=3003632 RepID=A0AAE9VWX0_9CAUD|nr:tail length tape measure protein [Pseudomonas phage PSV3]WBF76828.1 hypothetical protein PSV3_00126 [Pseudomonas phage PSV3]
MADENIEIKVQDKVSPSISTKLRTIASEARNADAAVKNLQTQLSAINVGGLSQLINASASATRQLQQGALAAQRLTTEQQRAAFGNQRRRPVAAYQRIGQRNAPASTRRACRATAGNRTATHRNSRSAGRRSPTARRDGCNPRGNRASQPCHGHAAHADGPTADGDSRAAPSDRTAADSRSDGQRGGSERPGRPCRPAAATGARPGRQFDPQRDFGPWRIHSNRCRNSWRNDFGERNSCKRRRIRYASKQVAERNEVARTS